MNWTIRPARDGDIDFLRDMLYEAATWRPGEGAAVEEILGDPHVSRYLAGWNRAGDTALVAVDENGQPAGAAWFRFFPVDEPGFGFIDEATPELSIGVRRDLRGRGIGTSLLKALIEKASREGISALSLSVETDNPARALYQHLGFRTVSESDGTHTMRLDIEGPLHIRRFNHGDLESVIELHHLGLDQFGANAGPGPWDDDLDDIPGHYLDTGGEFLIGTIEGRVVAMGALRRVSDDTGEVKRMRVRPELQRRGLGAKILDRLESTAKELGYSRLVLDTTTNQAPAQAFFRNHGYRETRRDLSEPFDLLYFEKDLP